jgi:acetyl esterase
MTEAEMLAETRVFNESLQVLLAAQPPIYTVPPAVTRLARREGRGIFPALVFAEQARTITIPGRGGEITLRLFEPESPRGAFLHLHGGGWTMGSADGQDLPLLAVAQATGLTVVSVDYRLAPEHPFPAGPDDCEDAALWLLENHTGRLAIGGESAGAHLAVLTMLRLRELHGISPRTFAAANLVFGAYDLTGTPSRHLWGDRSVVLSGTVMDWFVECFLPGMPDDERRAPSVSPLYAELHDMPPALFSCGTADPLLDDSLFMEARWRQAGNETTLSLWDEGVHGFTAFPIEIGRRSLAEQIAFVGG